MSDARPLLDPRTRAWSLVAAWACLLPLLLQLPGMLGAGVGATALAVSLAAWRRPMPGWLRLGLWLVLVGGVLAAAHFRFGRDTACALLAAMLAIKPAETATLRDARSLLGFALFAPFATFLLDQGPMPLVLGLFGALLALSALLQLAELESGDIRSVRPARRFASVSRLVMVGLPLALATFWLFPRLASPLWGVPERAMARPGLSDHMAPGEWLEILNDDSTALRVQFHGDTPPRNRMYWRGPVLWNYDGRTWTQARWMRNLPPARVRSGPVRWSYRIDLEPTDRRQLVALDLPLAAPDGTSLSRDYSLRAARPLTRLTRWEMQSAPPAQFATELPATLRRAALELPAGFNPRTIALARQWRREAGDDDEAIARRAMAMINEGFAYTLATPLLGRNAVDEFLFEQRAGYCEHFSSAFVVLMRAAGIPARVVTGYVGGYRNPIGDYWLVRNSDAHAWAEAWLPGRGWVRFDPTAAVAPERIFDTLADRAPGAGALGGLGGLTPVLDLGDWLRRGWNELVLGFDATRQRQLLRPLGVDDVPPSRLAALFVAVALLALAWMWWLTARAGREHDPVLRAWHRVGRRYARIGLGRAAHEPAASWGERVARERAELGPELQRLIRGFNSWRYAGDRETSTTAGLLRALRRHRPARATRRRP